MLKPPPTDKAKERYQRRKEYLKEQSRIRYQKTREDPEKMAKLLAYHRNYQRMARGSRKEEHRTPTSSSVKEKPPCPELELLSMFAVDA